MGALTLTPNPKPGPFPPAACADSRRTASPSLEHISPGHGQALCLLACSLPKKEDATLVPCTEAWQQGGAATGLPVPAAVDAAMLATAAQAQEGDGHTSGRQDLCHGPVPQVPALAARCAAGSAGGEDREPAGAAGCRGLCAPRVHRAILHVKHLNKHRAAACHVSFHYIAMQVAGVAFLILIAVLQATVMTWGRARSSPSRGRPCWGRR